MLSIENCEKKSVCLVDVDSSIPNLALMKLSSYFKKQGFKVDLKKLDYSGYEHHKREKTVIDGIITAATGIGGLALLTGLMGLVYAASGK